MSRSCPACVVALLLVTTAPADEPAAPAGRTLRGHTGAVTALAFVGDGRTLVTAAADKTARVWDVNSGKETRALEHGGALFAVAATADGRLIATAGEDGAAVWEAATGKRLLQLRGHKGAVAAVAFAPDGGRLATGGYDGTARLWDAKDGKAAGVLEVKDVRVTSLAFTPDGKRLLAGGVGYETITTGSVEIGTGTAARVRAWDLPAADRPTTFEVRGAVVAAGGRTATAAGLVPDIQTAGGGVSIDGFDQVTLFDPQTGKAGRVVKWRGWALAISADGKRLATGTGDNRHFRGFGIIAHNGVNGKNLDPRPRVWDAASGAELLRIDELPQADLWWVSAVALSADGSRLAAAVRNDVKLWAVPAARPAAGEG